MEIGASVAIGPVATVLYDRLALPESLHTIYVYSYNL